MALSAEITVRLTSYSHYLLLTIIHGSGLKRLSSNPRALSRRRKGSGLG